MSEKKKFTLYAGSVALCVCTAVLLHYVSVADPYLESACRLLRPFIYIGLYVVWAISFRKRIIPERNPSLPDCNRSNDDFLDVYPDVQI